jgi:hypothetical protein
MSTLNVANITDGTDTVETGYVINGSAKAWVNFNGTGTIAIVDSFNVASLTDIGTGNYEVNFSNNMSSGGYAPQICSNAAVSNYGFNRTGTFNTTAKVNVAHYENSTTVDTSQIYISAHGDLA